MSGLRRFVSGMMLACAIGLPLFAAELHSPKQVKAGTEITVSSSGSGAAEFLVIGPAGCSKQKLNLGEDARIAPEQTHTAGRYLFLACVSGTCARAETFVTSADPGHLTFIAHPSRVPVAAKSAISAVAVVSDKYENLVLTPVPVQFQIAAVTESKAAGTGAAVASAANLGIAWTRASSSPREGKIQITARLGSLSETRVVQQVASDPCQLRLKAQRAAQNIVAETEPVRDCSGNAVPDGTVVTFTMNDMRGRTTVDVPVKKGIARVELATKGSGTISAASGVVLGNEVRF